MNDHQKESQTLKHLQEEYHLDEGLLTSILLADLSDKDFWPEPAESNCKERASLNPVDIVPGKGDGNLFFGMSRKETEKLLGAPAMEDESSCYYELKMKSGRTDLVYQVVYREGKIEEFTLYDALNEDEPVQLHGINVFSEQAEEVIRQLEVYGEAKLDAEERKMATQCEFDSLGLSLWREKAFYDEMQEAPEYKNLSREDQNYEQSFRRFATVTLKR